MQPKRGDRVRQSFSGLRQALCRRLRQAATKDSGTCDKAFSPLKGRSLSQPLPSSQVSKAYLSWKDMNMTVKTKLPDNVIEALALTMVGVVEARAAQPVFRPAPGKGYPFTRARDFDQMPTPSAERMKKLANPDRHRRGRTGRAAMDREATLRGRRD